MTTQQAQPFTPETTRAMLAIACRAAGLDAGGARLIRMGENAMYHMAADELMVRIGRSPDAARKEVEVARWLQSHDFPAAQVADDVPQPIHVDGASVTFWEFIHESAEPSTSNDLARILHALHSLPEPPFTLPEFAPMPKVSRRLSALPPGYLSDADVEFLVAQHHRLEAEYGTLAFCLAPGPIHADSHGANLMRDRAGIVRLIDFEDFAWGPREWDVVVAAIRHHAFGWLTKAEYDDYARTYGFDALQWSGYSVLRAIRELNMTTWLAQRLGESDAVDAEVRMRVNDLRDPDAPRRWSAF